MNEHIQYILTYIVVFSAIAYVIYSLVNIARRKTKDGCSDIGCPNCGVRNSLKKSIKTQ